MLTQEIIRTGENGTLIYVVDCRVDVGSGLKAFHRASMDSNSVVPAQELEGTHDDPNSIIDSVSFQDLSMEERTVRCVRVVLKAAAQNGQEATVRWQWNTIPYEVKVKYIGE